MLETTENVLIESLSEALETMAFMMVMPADDELPAPDQGIHVIMNFTGPTSGTVELVAGADFAQMLAANVMGIDSEEDEARTKSADAFKELLNTTCGVLLPRLAGSPADIFDLTLPQATDFADDDLWDELNANFTAPELVELGFFIALTSGQQRWIKTLDIGHREVMADTEAGLSREGVAE